MENRILYLGDTTLREAASYLAGVMHHAGIRFDHVPSGQSFDDRWLEGSYRAFVLSDYASRNFSPAQLDALAGLVRAGAGLLMIGGWESYTGAGGDWGGTSLAALLPVTILPGDDRVNWAHPCVVEKVAAHPVLDGLPFDSACPAIGGFNRVEVKPWGTLLLAARRFTARMGSGRAVLTAVEPSDPLLVVGAAGKGRVAAFTSDVAPHWVGGLVDWGDSRVAACAEGSAPIEVGNWYARFFGRLLEWTAGAR